VSVEYAEGEVVRVLCHESHEESVVSNIVGSHDNQVEEVPNPGLLDVLRNQLPNNVVGVIAVTVQKGG
jgi:hypothetical protein